MEFSTWALPFAFVVSYVTMPLLERFATSSGIVAKRCARRSQSSTIPLLGGLGVYASFVTTLALFGGLAPSTSFLVASFPLLITGIADDIWELKPKIKFLAQFFCVFMWLELSPASIQLLAVTGLPSFLCYPLVGFWILGVMNATNLIDGLDGLASTFAILGCLATSLLPGMQNTASLFVMAAAYCGFLLRNFAPARIYLGDFGSQMIGFYLASRLLTWQPPHASGLNLLVPLFIFAFPEIDAICAMARRSLGGRSLFQGDQNHLHHQVLNLMQDVRMAWGFLTSVLVMTGAISFLLATTENLNARIGTALLATGFLMTILFFIQIQSQIKAQVQKPNLARPTAGLDLVADVLREQRLSHEPALLSPQLIQIDLDDPQSVYFGHQFPSFLAELRTIDELQRSGQFKNQKTPAQNQSKVA